MGGRKTEGGVGRIGLIGAGRAGGALARALARAGLEVSAVADLSPARAGETAAAVGAVVLEPVEAVRTADIIFMAVPDDSIASAAAELAPQLGAAAGKIFFHLSGAQPASLLQPLAAHGALGSFHPLVALADPETGGRMLCGCYYGLEGDPEAVAAGRALVNLLGGKAIILAAEGKAHYHAAAVLASNYLVALIDTALGLYARYGLDRTQALAAVRPLLEAAVSNLLNLGPERALTGPISRGDLETVRHHLAALAGEPADRVYRALGLATLDLAERAGRIGRDRAAEFAELLQGDTERL